jgi:hypothetical protein
MMLQKKTSTNIRPLPIFSSINQPLFILTRENYFIFFNIIHAFF